MVDAVVRAGDALQADTTRCWVAGRGGHVPWAKAIVHAKSWASVVASLHRLRPRWACDALRPWDWVNTGVLLVPGRCAARVALQWTRVLDALALAMRGSGEVCAPRRGAEGVSGARHHSAAAQDPYFLDTLSLLLLGRCKGHGVDVVSWLPPELNLQLNLAQGDFAANAFDEPGPLGPVVAQYAVGTLKICCRGGGEGVRGRPCARTPRRTPCLTLRPPPLARWPRPIRLHAGRFCRAATCRSHFLC